jgi:hypothetical protein
MELYRSMCLCVCSLAEAVRQSLGEKIEARTPQNFADRAMKILADTKSGHHSAALSRRAVTFQAVGRAQPKLP